MGKRREEPSPLRKKKGKNILYENSFKKERHGLEEDTEAK